MRRLLLRLGRKLEVGSWRLDFSSFQLLASSFRPTLNTLTLTRSRHHAVSSDQNSLILLTQWCQGG